MSQPKAAAITSAYIAALLLIAAIRFAADTDLPLAALAPYATGLYIATVVLAVNLLMRSGVNFDSFGFTALRPQHLLLALLGVVAIQILPWGLTSLWEAVALESRDLSRFESVSNSTRELLKLLALSWTFAAFGEELAFRILLLRSLVAAMGSTRWAVPAAVLLQALVFGAVHAYQGTAGAIETFFSGLVYGTITVLGGYAIWPAAVAHGLGNSICLLRLYYSP